MAIAFDTSTSSGSSSTSTLTRSHTCSGADRVLVVFVKVYNTSNLLTSVTYYGVGLTQVTAIQDASNRWSYSYILDNPATGANNVVVNLSSATFVSSSSHSYTGCATSGIPDASAASNIATVDVSISATTTVDNCWLVGAYAGARTYTAGGGTTQRQVNTNADYLVTFDSNSPKTPAGTYSLAGTQSSATACSRHIISLAPVASSPAAQTARRGVVMMM